MSTESFSPEKGGVLDQESAAGLFGRLIGDASALVRNEVALAKKEFADAVTNAKLGAVALAIASMVLLAGALCWVAALILALVEVMAPWAAAALVGGLLIVAGVILIQGAKRKLSVSPDSLSRTKAALQQDAAVIARRNS